MMKLVKPAGLRGMTLIEFLVGITLSVIVLAALGHAFMGSKVTFQLNRGFATLQDNSRFSLQNLETHIRMAGYQDRAVGAGPVKNFLKASPGSPSGNDAITLRFGAGKFTSITDCAGNLAPPNNIVELTYSLSNDDELLCVSDAQPDDVQVRQIVATGIDQFRIQYAVDDNDDGVIDRTVRDPDTTIEQRISIVELCLVASSGTITDALTHTHYDCDGVQKSTDDGLMRRRFTATIGLRNRR